MQKLHLIGVFIATLMLSSCAAVGVVTTSDPTKKLDDAGDLYQRHGRPLPAERLIQEAITIFQAKDDVHGLGNAYREYADLLKSAAVAKWEKFYRRDGFLDKAVTYDNRLEKATEFYKISLQYYLRAEARLREENKFDSLTNVYYNMAYVHAALGNQQEECDALDRTLDAYGENIRRNPSAKTYGSVVEMVNSVKRKKACP